MQTTTIVHEHHNPRTTKSPIRKQLVNKLVSYYNQLDEIRSKSPNRRTMPINRNRHYLSHSILEPKKKNSKTRPKHTEYYFDPKMRKTQLEELRDLMYNELHRAKVENTLKHDDIDVYECMTGYPSFVRETADALKMKNRMRKEPWDSRNNDFKSPVHKLLEQKVYHSHIHAEADERDPEVSVGRVTTSRISRPGSIHTTTTVTQPFYDKKLYPLNTDEKILRGNSAEYDQLDFHERKAKEIRRLQYVADWEARRKRKRSRTPVKRRKWKVSKFREVADSLAKEELNREEKIRSILELERLLCNEFNSVDSSMSVERGDPSNAHPIWILLGASLYPARISCPLGFKISKFTNTFEVREGDEVIIHANELEGSEFAPKGYVAQGLPKSFIGTVRKPNQMDREVCKFPPNFIIEEPTGERYPILLNKPFVEKRVVTGPPMPTNCEVFNNLGQFIGRGDLKLRDQPKQKHTFYYEGIMIDRDNKVHNVLINREDPGTIIYKCINGERIMGVIDQEESVFYENFGHPVNSTVTNVHYDQFNNRHTKVENVTSYPKSTAKVQILTLKESDYYRPPRVIHFNEERPIQIESKNILLDGEEGLLLCEDNHVYHGRLEIDRGNNVFLRAYPCPENGFTHEELLRLKVDTPEEYPYPITRVIGAIHHIAEERGRNWNPPSEIKRVSVTQRMPPSPISSSRVSIHSNPSVRSEDILNSIQHKLSDINLTPGPQVKRTTVVDHSPSMISSPVHHSFATESYVDQPRIAPKPRKMNGRQVVNRKLFHSPNQMTEVQENVNIIHREPKVTQETTTTSFKPDRNSLHKRTTTTTKVQEQPPLVHVDRRVKTTSHIPPRPTIMQQNITSYSHNHTFGREEPILQSEIIEEILPPRPKSGKVNINVDVENEQNVDIRVNSRPPSPNNSQRIIRKTVTTNPPPLENITIQEHISTNPITGEQRVITTEKKSPLSNKNTHYTEGSFIEDHSPFGSPKEVKVTHHYSQNNSPLMVDSAASLIQKEWRKAQWNKTYNSSEEEEEGAIYETIHHDERLETLRDTLGNDEDFVRFLNFYKTLPQNVDYDKAYQLFQNMMNQLRC